VISSRAALLPISMAAIRNWFIGLLVYWFIGLLVYWSAYADEFTH
jgi:hypothetical protein